MAVHEGWVVSAGAFDVIANFLWQRQAVLYQIELIIEELGEMLGGTFILWAIRDLLISHGIRIVVLPKAELIDNAIPHQEIAVAHTHRRATAS